MHLQTDSFAIMYWWFVANVLPWIYFLITLGCGIPIGYQIYKVIKKPQKRPKYINYLVGSIALLAFLMILFSMAIYVIIPKYI